MQQLARLSFRLSDLRTGVWDSPKLVAAMLLAALIPLAGCSTASPPTRQADICEVFQQYPDWYDYARKSASRWGTPIHVQMSFVRHESSYRGDARPPRQWLWFIPLGRPSSAKGYAQAQDPVWNEYQAERGRLFRSRGDMEDALDFIGWYNQRTKTSARHTPHRRAAPLPRLPRRARRLSAGHLEGQTEGAECRPAGRCDGGSLQSAACAL